MGLTGGLLDNQDPKTLGLLGLAQGLLQASGPSRTPVSFGQALGGGLQGMQQAREEALKNQLMQAQIKKSSMEKISPGESIYDVNTGKPVISSSIFGGLPGAAGGVNGAQGTPGTPQLSGDSFLQTLPPSAASQVKAIAEGKMPFPSGFALKTPYWQQMLSAVSQYDPSFDAVNYNARSKARGSFTSGPDANNITALNTAMNHAASLKDAYDSLGNTNYPAYNSLTNYLGNALGSQNTQTNTAAVAARGHALSGELAKVFRSSGMAESDIKAWEDKLSTSATPAQSKEILNSAMDLMEGRLSALAEKYNQGMGTSKQGIELLSPAAQKAYLKVRGSVPQTTSSNGIMPQQAGQPQGQPQPTGPRPVTMDEVNATAQKYGIPPQKVAQDLQAKGYTIQGAPQQSQQPQVPQVGGAGGGW